MYAPTYDRNRSTTSIESGFKWLSLENKRLKEFLRVFRGIKDIVDASKDVLGSKFSVEGMRIIVCGNEKENFHAIIEDNDDVFYSFVFVLPLTGSMNVFYVDNNTTAYHEVDKMIMFGCGTLIAWENVSKSKCSDNTALRWIVTNNPAKEKQYKYCTFRS
jgi:hypothetical protein